MSNSTRTETFWWNRPPPPPTSRADEIYDDSLDVVPDPDPYSLDELDHFSDLAADRYERHMTAHW